MNDARPPPPVQPLDHLASVDALRALLALAERPDEPLPPEALGDHEVEDAIAALVEARLAVRTGDGRVALAEHAKAPAARLLAAWRTDPLPILRQLTRRSMDRLRSAAARAFADAFVVRRGR